MNFLHGSKIEFHGHLKSENCMIDGRFVVKLSGYSLRELTKQTIHSEEENPWTKSRCKKFRNKKITVIKSIIIGIETGSLLWTAPEHLRRRDPYRYGSKKGDVYSFAIVLQEVITRSLPFEPKERFSRTVHFLSPEEQTSGIMSSNETEVPFWHTPIHNLNDELLHCWIGCIDRLRRGTTPPYRPEIAYDECPSDMLDLIKKCWDENPEARPTFPEIKHKLKKITK
ncbi:UNVERIFIED_CONTAM: Npr1 [Trichonephila clavipes]